jgi:cystathionine beta-lyase
MSGGGDDSTRKPATRLIRGGRRPEWTGPVVNPPVWRASTHLYASDAERREAGKHNNDGQFFYGRRGAPTQWALAEARSSPSPAVCHITQASSAQLVAPSRVSLSTSPRR